MCWNYRIILHDEAGDPYFALHEAFYQDNEKTPRLITVLPIDFLVGEDEGKNALIHSLEMALKDAKRHKVLRMTTLKKHWRNLERTKQEPLES